MDLVVAITEGFTMDLTVVIPANVDLTVVISATMIMAVVLLWT